MPGGQLRICTVHNEYLRYSGEEAIIDSEERLLAEHGHEVARYRRSSNEIAHMRLGKTRAFLSGLGNRRSRRDLRRFLEDTHPDIVHVHNVYPFISPSALGACRSARLPLVMSVHNYRLVCPNGLFFSHGSVCERCVGGREYWCVLRNCESDWGKSLAYALRTWRARRRGDFRRNVDVFAVLTRFQRTKLADSGFPDDRMLVMPNMAPAPASQPAMDAASGSYVAYIGRTSTEKGLAVLVEASRQCPGVEFRAAGSWSEGTEVPFAAPANLQFCGEMPHEQIADFIAGSRAVVFPSLCYEAFPVAVVEAMMGGRPVLASNTGGLAEIVDDGKTGLLFETGNAGALAEKIRFLWERPALCQKMGEAGRQKALEEYSAECHYKQLLEIYAAAQARHPADGST